MEAPWNLCNPLPAAEPVLMDSLEGSPRSVSHIKGEVTHFAAQRRSSAPFENPYARQQPQYSVQGSTSTPNSVGPSSGSVSPDGSTQQTDSNGVLIEWMKPTDDNESYDITYAQPSDVKPRYCYVVHGQHPATLPRNELFNPSILPPNCTSSTAPRPVHLVFGMSPSASLHFSPPSTQRSTSVPRQIGDHSHPAVVKINTSAAPKATKRKSSQEPNRPPKKPAVPRDSTPKQAPKSGISALTRRRLRIAQRPGEMMPRARLPLTELTVEDLKTLCRKRNFPISGTKADLYKRLQPIEDQLDIEAMLLEAIEEEDLRMAEANAGSDEAGVKSTCSEATATAYTVATALLPQERRPSSQSGVNQFDVAISDYLMQHQKQLNQQRSSQRPISIENTCTWTTSSSCSIRKLGEKPPLTHIQPLVRLVPRKPNESEEGKQNGSTFHYAEMGSGGQFTLEPTAKNVSSTTIRSGNVVKFIADPAIFRPPPVAAPPKRPVEACCEKCTERQTNTTTDGNTEELHKLIKELTVSPANASTDNPSLTAKILALHERVLSVQTTKLRAMATAIADSQKTLQCQQRLIKDVRREAKKVHSEQPSPLESLVRTVDVLELEKQHAKQTDELRKLQQSHQRMKNEQEALGRSEMELQEEIHVEQAVEDVARLIRTNRRTALLIVQLVHKFQCDRMRELDQSQSAAPLRRVPAAAANAAANFAREEVQFGHVFAECRLRVCSSAAAPLRGSRHRRY
ncbi:hypothetical protein M3Y99_00308200 [Aphelenchoides fujianensis]|nr:hypothetical protein M3Y99_00308200 [Aphelenchoides fujianensis]